MKILRSQYLQLQGGGEERQQQNFANNGVAKMILKKGKQHAKGKQELQFTVAPTRFPNNNGVVRYKATSPTPATDIEILIENADESLKKLNVVLEYVDMSALWLTKVYKTYENELWQRKPRLFPYGKNKWIFCCGLCSKVYKYFCSIKNHLNQHLELYPYVCKICLKRYTARKPATFHLRKVHKLEKHEWNDFLTS